LLQEASIWAGVLVKVFGPWAESPLAPAWVKNIVAGAKSVEGEFIRVEAAWQAMDAKIAGKELKAKITADIADLNTNITLAKAKLADPSLTKTKRAKLELDLAQFRLQKSIAEAGLVEIAKKKTKPKIQAAIDDLESKLKAARKKLKGVHDSKTRAKVKGDIKAAEAAIARLKALLKGIKDEEVKINITRTVTMLTRTGIGPNEHNLGGVGHTWQAAALSGGSATSRTEAPTVNIAPAEVTTRVFIDGREVRIIARSTVADENNRQTWRARVGRRR
jgi:hypothetical protein